MSNSIVGKNRFSLYAARTTASNVATVPGITDTFVHDKVVVPLSDLSGKLAKAVSLNPDSAANQQAVRVLRACQSAVESTLKGFVVNDDSVDSMKSPAPLKL